MQSDTSPLHNLISARANTAWANAVIWGYETIDSLLDTWGESISPEDIRAIWPAECEYQYRLARAWSGVSARLSGSPIMDSLDAELLDRRRAESFAREVSPADFVVDCPV